MATTQQTNPLGYAPAAGEYGLDTTHSYVSFTARHMMITKTRGRFPVTEGKLVIGENPAESSVEATIDVSAVETGDPKRDEHLRSADFFDTENHRYATFRSTSVDDSHDGEFVLHGDLTIRGETRPVELKGEFLGTKASPFGDTRVGFSAEVEVSRKEWGLEWNVALDTGGVLVGDKVKLVIDAEWIAQ